MRPKRTLKNPDALIALAPGQVIRIQHEGVDIELKVLRPMYGKFRDLAAQIYLESLEAKS